MREYSRVQQVRIGENDMAFFANGSARVGGRVAVVSENAEAIFQSLVEVVKFGELVLCESFCWKEIQRTGVGIFKRRVQNRQVVTERFSGGGGRDDDNIFSGVNSFGCFGLVGIKPANAFSSVGRNEIGVHPRGEVGPLSFAGG